MSKKNKLPQFTHIVTKILCPNCGIEKKIVYSVDTYKIHDVVLCEFDDGGCEEYFILFNPYEVEYNPVSVRALRKEKNNV